MGLGSTLKKQNQQTANQLGPNNDLVSKGGYNSQNIPSLPSAPPVTNEELQHMQSVVSEAVRESTNPQLIKKNTTNLVKPNIPANNDTARYEINKIVVEKMWRIVCLKGLYPFFTQERLQELVNRACTHDYRILKTQFNVQTIDTICDLAVLGLYDVVLLGDDSSSMRTKEPKEDNMTRHEIMKEVIKTLSFWGTLMDADGIVVRFFNSSYKGDGISNQKEVEAMFDAVSPSGSTPMGQALKTKVLNEFVFPKLADGSLQRPILILTVTDGIPDNQQDVVVVQAIIETKQRAINSKFGEYAVAFGFSQIGSDSSATDWLGDLDKHKDVGHLIDCTSEFSIEKKECENNFVGLVFTESTWVIKSMIGAIDPAYDASDEQDNNQQPPPQYNQQPPQYNQQQYQQQYNQPQYQQQQYQQPQYQQQQFNQPPYGQQPNNQQNNQQQPYGQQPYSYNNMK